MILRLSVCLLIGAALAFSQQPPSGNCEPTPVVATEIDQLQLDVLRITGTQPSEVKKLAEAAVAKYPEDFFVNRLYQSLGLAGMRDRAAGRREMVQRYESLAGAHPGDPKYAVLYARALFGANTPLAIEVLKKAAAGNDDPQVQLALVDVYSFGKFADRAQARTHLEAYFAACPASLDGGPLRLLARFGGPEAMAKQAAALRQRLSSDSDPNHLRFWEDLWNLEFKARPVPEHEALRKQIAADLERIQATAAPKDVITNQLFVSGYKLADDKVKLRQAEDGLLAAYPQSQNAKRILRERWQKEHPYPKPDDAAEKKQAYYSAQLASADEHLERSPGEFEYLMDRFRALSELDSSSAEQVAAAGHAMLDALRKGADWYSVPPFEFQVARALLKKKVDVTRVPDLVAEGLKNFRERDSGSADDRMPDEFTAPDSGNAFYVKADAARILIDAAKQLGKSEIAAAAVAEVESIKTEKASSKSTILDVQAKFAELQGRKLDALLLYRAVMDARAADFKPPKKDELAENIARLRKELGGTDATAGLWERKEKKVEVAQGGGRWEVPKKAMPAWELPDLAGKTWKLASLEGKTLLINVWATWCGPCRSEHPYLEKLYQKVKDRPDVQVLTFNVDEQVGSVEPYIKENKFTFPVLLAGSYVSELLPVISIPRNWIVDAAGKWRFEQIGFGASETWESEVLGKLEQTKPEAAR